MSPPRAATQQAADLPFAVVTLRRRFSIVWVIPLIAAGVGAALLYQAWFGSGPQITIRFEDGAGLTPGQTPVHYHGIECGLVDSVSLSKDLSHVVVHVSLKKEAAQLAREGAKFWIVRPQVSLLGVHGLDTLVSGPYVQASPGTGPTASSFTGLTDPPPPETLEPGLDVVLRSERRGALRVGSPVYYRGVEVGKVKSYRLGKSAESVEVTAYIDAAHAALVRTTSRFWNVSGLQMNVGLAGVNFDLESIESLLAGGVAFDTPQETGALAKNGAVFRLEDTPPDEASSQRKAGLRITLIAQRLAGIALGSPVSYRQVRVGEVEQIKLAPDARWVHIGVRIDGSYRPLVRSASKFWNVSGVHADVGITGAKLSVESLQAAVGGGIQFATPEDESAAAHDGTIFTLYEKADPSWTEWAPAIAIADSTDGGEAAATQTDSSGKPRKTSPRSHPTSR
ncbi:MAG: intermembrane transport protein PqiB [Gaiellaceae bacterium]